MSNTRGAINSVGSAFAVAVVTATAISASIPTGKNPSHMLINVNTQAVRFTTDGTAPTATKGIHVAAGGQISFMDPGFAYDSLIRGLQVIQEVSAATLDILFFD